MADDRTSREHFEHLRQLARTAGLRGDFKDALTYFDEAGSWADSHGDQEDADLVTCGRSSILIHQGRSDEVIRDLQKVLMRSASPAVRHLAAYNLSILYEFREDLAKSRFYADLSRDHAQQAGNATFLANSNNQLGNLLTRDSRFEDAIVHYQEALASLAVDQELERLTLLLNIGYCHLTCGRSEDGFERLFRVRRGFIRFRISEGPVLGRLRLSLCFGYLEIGRYHRARLHAFAGLKIAEECGEPDLVKKALYLLGEVEKCMGDEFSAFRFYARLQEEFYPDQGYLPDLLLQSDTAKLVNLWA